jgi:hypothetical protein
MRTMVSLLSFQRYILTFVNALLVDISLHSLEELLTQEEKQLELILSLSLSLSLSLILQTFNMKSYIHTVLKQTHNRENKTTMSIPFNMYTQKKS